MKKTNDLSKLVHIVAPEQMSYELAVEQMKKGKCCRRKSWTEGRFMWYNPGRAKPVYSDAKPEHFTGAISTEFLHRKGVRKLTIGGHYNIWDPVKHCIHVGAFLSLKDREAVDWIEYEP